MRRSLLMPSLRGVSERVPTVGRGARRSSRAGVCLPGVDALAMPRTRHGDTSVNWRLCSRHRRSMSSETGCRLPSK